MERKFYSTEDIAEILGVPKRSIQAWIRRRELTALKLGREYRIRESDLQDFLKRKERPAANSSGFPIRRRLIEELHHYTDVQKGAGKEPDEAAQGIVGDAVAEMIEKKGN